MSKEIADMWAAVFEGFKQGAKNGWRAFFAPITPRVWRYAIAISRQRGLLRGVAALLFHGPDLLAEGRLLPSGELYNDR